MRTRMSGGVGRAVSNGGPYPIYVICCCCDLVFLAQLIIATEGYRG